MSKDTKQAGGPPSRDLHPAIYAIAIGLVAWFAVSAWALFDRRNDAELPLTMVSVLFFMAVLVPLTLWSISRRQRRVARGGEKGLSLREWALGDVAIPRSHLRAPDAAIIMLLPLAAVAFGLTAIGIVFVVTVSTVT